MTIPGATLARFDLSDARELLDLSESIGWLHTIEDWRTTLASGVVLGHRQESRRILSSAALYPYGPRLASIGVVIVRAEARRRGLARAAMIECLRLVADRPVMLVATPEGEPLYESLGFVTVEAVVKLIAPVAPSIPSASCRTTTDSDLPACLALDAAAFGADRSTLLENRRRQTTGGAMLTSGHGFGWAIPQRDLRIIGPIIAPDAELAAQLIGHLLRGHSGRVRIDVPSRHTALISRLTAAGFESHEQRPVMLRNADRLPGRRDHLFAMASLGFG